MTATKTSSRPVQVPLTYFKAVALSQPVGKKTSQQHHFSSKTPRVKRSNYTGDRPGLRHILQGEAASRGSSSAKQRHNYRIQSTLQAHVDRIAYQLSADRIDRGRSRDARNKTIYLARSDILDGHLGHFSSDSGQLSS